MSIKRTELDTKDTDKSPEHESKFEGKVQIRQRKKASFENTQNEDPVKSQKRPRRNERKRRRKEKLEQEKKDNLQTNDTAKEPLIKEHQDVLQSGALDDLPQDKGNTETGKSKSKKKSLVQRRIAQRRKRERYQASRKKQTTLDATIEKLTGSARAQEAAKSLSDDLKNAHIASKQGSVTSSLSSEDVLKGNEHVVTKPKNARERFKNALSTLKNTQINETEHLTNEQVTLFSERLIPKDIHLERAKDYLRQTGMHENSYEFKRRASEIRDSLKDRIAASAPYLEKRIETLRQRQSEPVRSGMDQEIKFKKQHSIAEIVNTHFQAFPLQKDQSHIRVDLNNHREKLKIPQTNIDDITETLIMNNLFKDIDAYHVNRTLTHEEREERARNNPFNNLNNFSFDEEVSSLQAEKPSIQEIVNQNNHSLMSLKPLDMNIEKSLQDSQKISTSDVTKSTKNTLQKLLKKKMKDRENQKMVNVLKSRLEETTKKLKSQ